MRLLIIHNRYQHRSKREGTKLVVLLLEKNQPTFRVQLFNLGEIHKNLKRFVNNIKLFWLWPSKSRPIFDIISITEYNIIAQYI